MRYLIGIDAGTSALKSVLYDETGTIIAQSSKEYEMQQPHNGWAQQNPSDWKEAMVTTIKEIVRNSGVTKEAIKGIGIAGQMHGLVMLDEHGSVLRPAILWCDQRTQEEVEDMLRLASREEWIENCGNPPLSGWTAAKILWVKKHEPQIYEHCKHLLLPKDYLRYVLTGCYASDVSDASGTQLFDVAHRCWSKKLVGLLEIDEALLPKVYESCEVVGTLLPSVATSLGLASTTCVVAGAGDNAAAAIGTGIVKTGTAFTTIGTSGVVYAHCDEMMVDPKGRLHSCCSAVPNAWHVMGVTQAAGASLKWFKDEFCQEQTREAKQQQRDVYDLINEEIDKIGIGANRLLYLPYLMGERTPHMDTMCRGVFFGLSAMHTKAHMARAIMEGVSYSLKDCYSIFEELQIPVNEMILCGGGARSEVWRKMLSNVLGCRTGIVSEEGPALGAMILAGVGSGVYESVESACEKLIHTSTYQEPSLAQQRRYQEVYEVYTSLYPALRSSFAMLAKLDRKEEL